MERTYKVTIRVESDEGPFTLPHADEVAQAVATWLVQDDAPTPEDATVHVEVEA